MNPITVETIINKNIQTVWDAFTAPKYIEKWNHASDDWECPHAENDLKVGGRFSFTMSAKDKSFSFDFTGTYTTIEPLKTIAYTMDGNDKRKAIVNFSEDNGNTRVVETFDPENINSEELQRGGWQSILNNFKAYIEGLK